MAPAPEVCDGPVPAPLEVVLVRQLQQHGMHEFCGTHGRHAGTRQEFAAARRTLKYISYAIHAMDTHTMSASVCVNLLCR